MELLKTESNYTKVFSVDEPGEGNACHQYVIGPSDVDDEEFCNINFQKGPIKENGVNGCQQEDLLAIVIHRLEGFQSGDFACIENAEALYHTKLALQYLNNRTKERQERGVEGLSKK